MTNCSWCRDTDVLCQSLTYSQGPPEVLEGDPPGASTRVYRPPFDEFEVLRVEVPAGESEIVTAKHVRPGLTVHLLACVTGLTPQPWQLHGYDATMLDSAHHHTLVCHASAAL